MKIKTKIGGIVGDPILYSRSPSLYNNYFKKYNIDSFYNCFQLPKKELLPFLEISYLYGYHYFNITQPFKKYVYKWLKNRSDIVKESKNVNLIIYKDQIWHGFNTDYKGFLEGYSIPFFKLRKGDVVLLIGTGGAAQTIYRAIINHGYRACVINLRGNKIPNFFSERVDFIENRIYPLTIFATSHKGEELIDSVKFSTDRLININYQSNFVKKFALKNGAKYYGGDLMLQKQFERNLFILKEYGVI